MITQGPHFDVFSGDGVSCRSLDFFSATVQAVSHEVTSSKSLPLAPNTVLASLTDEERSWLHAHPVIRVFQDPDWPPVEFADERGNPTGMTKDYLSLIERRLGLKFEPVLHLPRNANGKLLKRRLREIRG